MECKELERGAVGEKRGVLEIYFVAACAHPSPYPPGTFQVGTRRLRVVHTKLRVFHAWSPRGMMSR